MKKINDEVDEKIKQVQVNQKKKNIIWISITTAFAMVIVVSLILFFTLNRPLVMGDGSIDNPYRIYNVEQLEDIKNDVSACYRLENDIDLKGETWYPIFDFENSKDFSGVFDGNNYKIKNFIINDEQDISIGLFSGIEETGIVKNLTIEINNDMTFNERQGVIGFICGINLGTIENCSIEGESTITFNATYEAMIHFGAISGINEGNISACQNFSKLTVDSLNLSIGGLVGFNDTNGIIYMCVNGGRVTGRGLASADAGNYVGGIAGYNKGRISLSSNVEQIGGMYVQFVGGIVGWQNGGQISYCYNKSRIIAAYAPTGESNYVGGIAGWQFGDSEIKNCYNDGIIVGHYCGGIVGRSLNSTITNTHWLYQPEGYATYGDSSQASGTTKYTTFNSLHNTNVMGLLNAGLIYPVFGIDTIYGLLFVWQAN